jgi:hypothetical protein
MPNVLRDKLRPLGAADALLALGVLNFLHLIGTYSMNGNVIDVVFVPARVRRLVRLNHAKKI